MINFLHSFTPNPTLLELGPFKIHWYGLFIVLGILAALYIITKLAEKYNLDKNEIIDISFWIIFGGIIGGRIYHVFLELPYYLDNPLNIFKIWQGGLAIHGGIFLGLILSIILVKRKNINFWLFASIVAPGLALAQAIGRWGNYFNQELFGKPTDLPWGIPIETINRLFPYHLSEYFHPTFLYESIGNLLLFIILLISHAYIIKNKKENTDYFRDISLGYLILYSILRFSLEFIRIDQTPNFLGMRFPQIVSILIIITSFGLLFFNYIKKDKTEEKVLAKSK